MVVIGRRGSGNPLLMLCAFILTLGACSGATAGTPTSAPTSNATATASTTTAPTQTTSRAAVKATAANTARAGATPTAGAPTCAPGVDLLGFSDALDKAELAGTAVGGLSALAYDAAHDRYFALVDNERETPARVYTLRLPLGTGGLADPQIVAVTTLRGATGRPFTGRDFDGEGIAPLPGGDVLIASESEPAIRRFAPDGRLLAELPVPPRFLVAPRGEATANQTFESLALTPDGRSLFTAVEGPLAPDGLTGDGRGRIRILRYDAGADGFAPAAQHFYLAETAQGVSEIVALGDRDLLVLERGYLPGLGNTIRVYRVSLEGAADVGGATSLAAPELAPLPKVLLFDLAGCPAGDARNPSRQGTPLLDNFEGLALGPALPDGRRALLLVSDDNFSRTQVTRVVAVAFRP